MRRKAKPACDPDVGEAAEARPRLGPDPRPGALRRFHACAQVEAGSQYRHPILSAEPECKKPAIRIGVPHEKPRPWWIGRGFPLAV